MERITDLSFLETFSGGNRDKMKKYISMFIQLCPNALQSMKTHLDAGNYDGLRGAAHAIKPQISYMGIKGGDILIKTIEHNAASHTEVDRLPTLLSEFDTLCRKALEELAREIA